MIWRIISLGIYLWTAGNVLYSLYQRWVLSKRWRAGDFFPLATAITYRCYWGIIAINMAVLIGFITVENAFKFLVFPAVMIAKNIPPYLYMRPKYRRAEAMAIATQAKDSSQGDNQQLFIKRWRHYTRQVEDSVMNDRF